MDLSKLPSEQKIELITKVGAICIGCAPAIPKFLVNIFPSGKATIMRSPADSRYGLSLEDLKEIFKEELHFE